MSLRADRSVRRHRDLVRPVHARPEGHLRGAGAGGRGRRARRLRVTLQPTPASARAASRLVDPRAYELYLRGRQAAADRRLPDAIELFERAIAADAGLGEAFAGLADALRLRGRRSTARPTMRRGASGCRRRRSAPTSSIRICPQANLAMGADERLARRDAEVLAPRDRTRSVVRRGLPASRRRDCRTSIPRRRSRSSGSRWRSIRCWMPAVPLWPPRSGCSAETTRRRTR